MTVDQQAGAGTFRRYTGGWVTLPNETINDERLSFRARGVLAYLIGRPPGWTFAAERIARQSPREGREAILGALSELEEHGYVRRSRHRTGDGRIRTVTEAAATPGLLPPETGLPAPAGPAPAGPEPVNPSPKSETEVTTTKKAVRTEEIGGGVQRAPLDRARENERPCSVHHGWTMPCRRCALDRQLEQAAPRPAPEPTSDVTRGAALVRSALQSR